MEKFIEFIGNNYVWLLTITIILIFALIGYLVDTKRSKNNFINEQENEIEEQEIENLNLLEGKSLAETVNISKNINKDTMRVELTDNSILNEEILDDDIQSP